MRYTSQTVHIFTAQLPILVLSNFISTRAENLVFKHVIKSGILTINTDIIKEFQRLGK